MRITKAMQEKIFENIIADNHPLRVRADKVRWNVARLAADLVIEARTNAGFKSDAEIGALMNEVSALNKRGKVFLYFRTSFNKFRLDGEEVEEQYYYDYNLKFTVGGQRREASFLGELDKDHRLRTGIVTPGIAHEVARPYLGMFTPVEMISLPADHWVMARLQELESEVAAINGEHITLKSTVFATLNKFSTVKKLVAHWPEVEKYIPKDQPVTGTGVAISVADLNAMCGIPK